MSSINLDEWSFAPDANRTEIGNPAYSAYYADDDVYIENGVLVIRSQYRTLEGKDYTSGLIMSKRNFQLGRFEFRFNAPKIQGVGPAIWMKAADNTWPPEIDFLEVPYPTLTAQGASWFTKNEENDFTYIRNALSDGWHTLSVEWRANWIEWTLDGNPMGGIHTLIPNQEMYLIINQSIGAPSHGTPDPADFPCYFYIDYFRHYR